jgi:hypothetical protein
MVSSVSIGPLVRILASEYIGVCPIIIGDNHGASLSGGLDNRKTIFKFKEFYPIGAGP